MINKLKIMIKEYPKYSENNKISNYIIKIDLIKTSDYNDIYNTLIDYYNKFEEFIEKHKHIFKELKDILYDINNKEYKNSIKHDEKDILLVEEVESILQEGTIKNNTIKQYQTMKDSLKDLSNKLDFMWNDYIQTKSELIKIIYECKKSNCMDEHKIIEYENIIKNEKVNISLINELRNIKNILISSRDTQIKKKKEEREELITNIIHLLDKNPNYDKYKVVKEYCNDKQNAEDSKLIEYKEDIDV